MKITLKDVLVGQLIKDYKDNQEEGVKGYGGLLDIRPEYQREFRYEGKKREAVIDSLFKGFPLNVMYWAKIGNDKYEIIDGQQRTLSICQFINGDFSYKKRYFHNLKDDEKQRLLNYKLMVYVCDGEPSEKLEWFEIVNIGGEVLTQQELFNAIYAGPWVTDARRYFSKKNCVAYQIGSDYLSGSVIKQDYLETVIKWISDNKIENYMAINQNQPNAISLWKYFQEIIFWIERNFRVKRSKFMRGVDWGFLYRNYKLYKFNPEELEKEISTLIADDDVLKKKGIYSYVLTREERYLNLRTFSESMKQKVYEKQKGICFHCKKNFDISFMEADHITPWIEGGKTLENNCQILCRECNRRKGRK